MACFFTCISNGEQGTLELRQTETDQGDRPNFSDQNPLTEMPDTVA